MYTLTVGKCSGEEPSMTNTQALKSVMGLFVLPAVQVARVRERYTVAKIYGISPDTWCLINSINFLSGMKKDVQLLQKQWEGHLFFKLCWPQTKVFTATTRHSHLHRITWIFCLNLINKFSRASKQAQNVNYY